MARQEDQAPDLARPFVELAPGRDLLESARRARHAKLRFEMLRPVDQRVVQLRVALVVQRDAEGGQEAEQADQEYGDQQIGRRRRSRLPGAEAYAGENEDGDPAQASAGRPAA